MRSTSCKLMWKKPESDGGSPLVGYTVEKKSVEKNNWVPCASGRNINTVLNGSCAAVWFM